ncbi:TonB-dependent receptor [Henriciella marina]|uniref:TonB-dependent receptor n=1 Tax=Henriciella marina TaxID=453851 RepID=A0ABT4LS55_9PROT|nr:TonB-dependent receptor [Henriciella marina]MCZ4297189.1 TonB-dependent receptor [Henriciella marina]
MSNWKLMSGVAAATLFTAAIVAPAEAQVTTSGVRGQVTDASGSPIVGADVIVRDPETGLVRTTTTTSTGAYVLRNLPVGQSYTVEILATDFQGRAVENVSLSLGDQAEVNFSLDEGNRTMDTVVVTASSANLAQVAIGPSATFGTEVLNNAPAINRNITDILRLDPRVYVDESRGDINGVQCGGKNSRFNSLTVDGVRLNDNFGLNSNGYPTERIPFSYDAIDQVSIELAPFDVQYGGFSACNINAVTKSGSNEFHGYAFGDYTNDGLRGDSLEGDDITTGEYDEYRYGFGIGGPILQDRLFFFAAYEKLEGVNLFDRGPIGSGAVNEVQITQAEIDEIRAIAQNIYGYDPGEIPSSFDNEDEKILVKLDWNINQNHRASFTYNWNDGFNIVPSDGDLSELEFSNHLYERGSELEAYVGSLYSDWTSNFSTEIRVGYSELQARQNSLGGTDFGEITIETDDVHVYIGGDDSRQSNELNYETLTLALKGFYTLGNHNFSFGYEQEALDVFNLFVQHTETEIDFDGRSGAADAGTLPTAFDPAIENFRAGFADNINYNNAPSGNPEDAAADWGYEVHTVYAQDEYDFGNGLVLTGGLRYDWYATDDRPETNLDFFTSYGFKNDQNLDGKGLLQPRLGFTFDVDETLDLRGGVGIYSGGNPNVWLSNTYSANNVLQFGADGGAFGLEQNGGPSIFTIPYTMCEAGVPTGPGWCVPQAMADAVATGQGSNFEINYLDPNFEIPYEWKWAFGATKYLNVPALGGEYVVSGDILFTQGEERAVWIRGDLDQTGFTTGPDGRQYPTYASVRERAFVLTNSESSPKSLLLSGSIAKEYDFGLDWSFGYAYSDSEDVHPMTSSVAFSNYNNRAFGDPQDVSAARSDYNIEHRFTALVNYEHAFFGDNITRFSAFGQANSGLPYSLTINEDPNSFTRFDPFLEGNPFLAAGQERNGEDGSWWGKVDIKVEQEFALFNDHVASGFVVIDNFTNLLNDEWGVLRQRGFPAQCTVDVTGQPTERCESRIGDASRYEIRFGLRYEF